MDRCFVFFIFFTVYVEKFTNEAQNLLTWFGKCTLNWDNALRQYDEQFRKLEETFNIPCQIPVQKLRLKNAKSKFYLAKLQQSYCWPVNPKLISLTRTGEKPDDITSHYFFWNTNWNSGRKTWFPTLFLCSPPLGNRKLDTSTIWILYIFFKNLILD